MPKGWKANKPSLELVSLSIEGTEQILEKRGA